MKREPRALLITDIYLPEVGGTVTWFHNVYRRYPAGTVWVVTQSYPTAKELDKTLPGMSIHRHVLKRHRFLKPESLFIYLKLFFVSAWLVLRHRIDVIYASKVLPEGLIAKLVSRIFRVPYCVYAHGEEICIFSLNDKQRPYLPKVYNPAAAVIANSRFTESQLRAVGCHGRNVVRISPGVDPEHFKPGPKDAEIVERFALGGKTVLLSVGRLIRRKGHDHVIRALPGVLERHPDLVYLILSGGEDEGYLRELVVELGLQDAVRFAGEVPFDDLSRYYNTADIFVMANRQLSNGHVEGFGIVFLEASACGKPVIAGDSGGTGEPVRDGWNGRRVDGTSVPSIAEAIAQLAGDPELRKVMGENGRRMVEEEYSWSVVTEKTRRLDRSIVERGQPDRREALGSLETRSKTAVAAEEEPT